ncbi:TetR/AcrR family transcriptional regulator [Nocardioides sp.]|uniref:TetR/AcrR family transcriptional regulator n=1 Tax=Nocardioides sp. TaxID=35761 RepID=UPI003510D8BE
MPDSPTRARLLDGALACLRETDPGRVTFAEVARRTGIARQTLYAHFPDRDALLHAAVRQAALDLTARLEERTRTLPPSEAVVESLATFHAEARRDPALAHVIAMTLHPAAQESGTLSAQALALTRGFLRRRVAEGTTPQRLEEMAEVALRTLLSLLAYDSATTETPQRLREYLRATLLPALDLADGPHRATAP